MVVLARSRAFIFLADFLAAESWIAPRLWLFVKALCYTLGPITLNQPGSVKSVNYRGLFSFGLAFTRCKLTSPGRRQRCNRALRFQEFGQNGAEILLYLDRARPDRESASPRILRGPGREIDRNVPGAALHCGPRPGRTSPALGWSVLTVKPVGSKEVGMVAPRQNF
jgi:hypothetical protein